MAVDPAQALARVPLLEGIEPRHLERLARQFRERSFPAGAAVTREGEPGVGFFVIVDGEAEVTIGGEPKAQLGQGDALGELALIDEGPRTATVTATTELRCLVLSPWEFKPFVEEHPTVAWSLLQTLAGRLRALE